MSDEKFLHTTWFGTFMIEGEEVIAKRLFEKDPETIADKRYRMKEGEVLDVERELAADVKGELKVTSERLSELGEVKEKDVSLEPEDHSFDEALLQEALTVLGERELREDVDPGQHLAKAVKTIQDLNETINVLMERLRDWYSLHYPELKDEVDDHEFIELISELTTQGAIRKERPSLPESTGGGVRDVERDFYRRTAELIREKRELREDLWDYVEENMRERAPTMTEITGPRLGAELIASAGSLKELAMKPASTVQVLGAEKALFRHLEDGTKPPKHGLILQHPFVHRADQDVKGKVARAFANKTAIAARVDHFGTENRGEELREELEERIEEIKERG